MKLSDFINHRSFAEELQLFENYMISILTEEVFETMPGFIQWVLFEDFTEQDIKSMLKTLLDWLNEINLEKKDEHLFVLEGKTIAKSHHKRGRLYKNS